MSLKWMLKSSGCCFTRSSMPRCSRLKESVSPTPRKPTPTSWPAGPATWGALTDLWHAALTAGPSIRAGAPQVKHDFATMSHEELGTFFRGLHAGALATGEQLANTYEFERFHRLLDVGGGSGGLAIAACQRCPGLTATIIDLPRVAPIARAMVSEAKLGDRVEGVDGDISRDVPPGRSDVAVLRNLIQVLGPGPARNALRNVGAAVEPGGSLIIVGHVLEDNRLAPAAGGRVNLPFGRTHS